MIRIDILEIADYTHVQFVTTLQKKWMNNPDDIIRQLSNNVNHLCQTLSHNMNINDNNDSFLQLEYLV